MNKKRETFFKLLLDLKNILNKKPNLEKMKEEVRLMGFHIRPLDGNPDIINKVKNDKFIEVLWTLGKIDILMEKNFHQLTMEQKKLILQSIEKIKNEIDLTLPVEESPSFKKQDDENTSPYLMLEIFRKGHLKKNIN